MLAVGGILWFGAAAILVADAPVRHALGRLHRDPWHSDRPATPDEADEEAAGAPTWRGTTAAVLIPPALAFGAFAIPPPGDQRSPLAGTVGRCGWVFLEPSGDHPYKTPYSVPRVRVTPGSPKAR